MNSLVFFNAVRGSQAEAASQTPSLTSDVTPGQSRAPCCPSSAGIYRTQLLFIEPVHTRLTECVLEPLMPPPRRCISISCTQLSCLFTFTLHLPLSHPFFFHFRPPPLSHSSPFFSRQTMLFIPQVSYVTSLFVSLYLLSFSSLSLHLARLFSPPFFFLIPLRITSRAAAPVRRQYRQMRTFPLIISLMQSALTKRRISNNYS